MILFARLGGRGMMELVELLSEESLQKLVQSGSKSNRNMIKVILEKAKGCQGISLEEASTLLALTLPEDLELLYQAAKEIKQHVYGNRVVLFAPLYTSNECTNNCLYCGFRRDNTLLDRKTLTMDEIVQQAMRIEQASHKRVLLICGEDPKKTDITHIVQAMKAIYDAVDIRRINVEAAPMKVEDYRLLKEAGVGTYVIFQETYHRETYKKMHPPGTKSDYDYRLSAIERAFEGGIDDVGIGALLGLYDYRYEVLAMLDHAAAFERLVGVGPHTVSVPRLRPAVGWALNGIPNPVSDRDFKKLIAVIRLALPYTGIILSTRESAAFREELLSVGVSQFSAGSKTNPGGYDDSTADDVHGKNENGQQVNGEKKEEHSACADQFLIDDDRSVEEVLEAIVRNGYLPSFCTACYRRERTGAAFMEHAKNATINLFCQPNAILTFYELLVKTKNASLKASGMQLLEQGLDAIKDPKLLIETQNKMRQIEQGVTDLYF